MSQESVEIVRRAIEAFNRGDSFENTFALNAVGQEE